MSKKKFWLPNHMPPYPERRRRQLMAKFMDDFIDLILAAAILALVFMALERTYRHYYPKEIHADIQGHSPAL